MYKNIGVDAVITTLASADRHRQGADAESVRSVKFTVNCVKMLGFLLALVTLGVPAGSGIRLEALESEPGVGGVFSDPYGRAVAACAPVGWWRFNSPSGDSNAPCISCSSAAAAGKRCTIDEPGCAATVDKTGAISQGQLLGQGGVTIPDWERLFHHPSFTFEIWIRHATRALHEQAVASCGSVVVCAGGDSTCQRSPVSL
jgi:hypothetical protein